MSLDPTASEFYFRSSIKKYFIDSLYTASGIRTIFDKTILYDNVASYSVTEWVVINFGSFGRDLMGAAIIDINCCTRKDAEGVDLSKLSDIVIGYLTDTTKTDTLKRIMLYNSTLVNPLSWTEITNMIVKDYTEGPQDTTADQTKVKTITVELSWGMII